MNSDKVAPCYTLNDQGLRALGLALTGAHRTGKTTLAKFISDKNEIPFIQTSLTTLANHMGVKIGLDMPFDQRRSFQEEALAQFARQYEAESKNGMFVTDRCPLDLIAYVVTAWHPAFADAEMTAWATDYVTRCIALFNQYFLHAIIVQPAAIPYVEEAQKAENIDFYREALNTTIIGTAWGDTVDPVVSILPRGIVDFTERAKWVTDDYADSLGQYVRTIKQSLPMQ